MSEVKNFMTLLTRDEDDILGYHLAYHFRHGVEHMIVTNNGSTDSTSDILKQYEKEGLVTIINEPEHVYHQSLWVTNMNKLAKEMGAKYVINADTDEFFCHTSGNIYQELIERQVEGLKVPYLKTALIDSTHSLPFPQNTLYVRTSPIGVKIIYKVPSSDSNLVIEMGNHNIQGINAVPAAESYIIEFNVRGRKQFFNKVIMGGSSLEKSNLDPMYGSHMREWYRMYKEGTLNDEYFDNILLKSQDLSQLLMNNTISPFNAVEFLHS